MVLCILRFVTVAKAGDMKAAINYTPQAAQLLKQNHIQLDLFKCPDWPDLIAEAKQYRPVYVHFPLHAGAGNIEKADWEHVEALLASTDTHYVNVHIAPHVSRFPGLELHTRDSQWIDPIVEAVIDELQPVIDRFGAEKIILENTPFDPRAQYSIPYLGVIPETINRILRRTGCGFLLDTAHARISSLTLEQDDLDYLDALDLSNLKEVHVTGTAFDSEANFWRDHFAMTTADWRSFNHVMAKIERGDCATPEIIALEYGGVGPLFDWRSDPEVIQADMTQLIRTFNKMGNRLQL